MNWNNFQLLQARGAAFRNSFEHFLCCSFYDMLFHSWPVLELEGLKIRFLDLMSFLIKVSQPGLIAVPTFGRCNVNINLVSWVFFGCHANLLQTFIRVIGRDTRLIFDEEGGKKLKKRSFAVIKKFSLTEFNILSLMDKGLVKLLLPVSTLSLVTLQQPLKWTRNGQLEWHVLSWMKQNFFWHYFDDLNTFSSSWINIQYSVDALYALYLSSACALLWLLLL